MPAWSWIVIAAAVVIVVAMAVIVARSVNRRKRSERLKNHFGPEYERAVGEAGDQRAGEKELVARERKRQKLDIVALAPEAHAKYAEHWRTVQTAFVDNPSRAVGDADRLVTQVMRERGYPVDDFDQRAADISVDHPNVVEHYRAAHILHWRKSRATSAPRRSVRRSSITARSSRSCSRPISRPIRTRQRRHGHDNPR